MSDPVSNPDIEDVLSSIRRLVSEEPMRRKPVDGETDEQVGRLVLTPAFRVSEEGEQSPSKASDAATAGEEPQDAFQDTIDAAHTDAVADSDQKLDDTVGQVEEQAADDAVQVHTEDERTESTSAVQKPSEPDSSEQNMADISTPEQDITEPEVPIEGHASAVPSENAEELVAGEGSEASAERETLNSDLGDDPDTQPQAETGPIEDPQPIGDESGLKEDKAADAEFVDAEMSDAESVDAELNDSTDTNAQEAQMAENVVQETVSADPIILHPDNAVPANTPDDVQAVPPEVDAPAKVATGDETAAAPVSSLSAEAASAAAEALAAFESDDDWTDPNSEQISVAPEVPQPETRPEDMTLQQRIAELEAAIEKSPHEWEPDGSEDGNDDETRPLSVDLAETADSIAKTAPEDPATGSVDTTKPLSDEETMTHVIAEVSEPVEPVVASVAPVSDEHAPTLESDLPLVAGAQDDHSEPHAEIRDTPTEHEDDATEGEDVWAQSLMALQDATDSVEATEAEGEESLVAGMNADSDPTDDPEPDGQAADAQDADVAEIFAADSVILDNDETDDPVAPQTRFATSDAASAWDYEQAPPATSEVQPAEGENGFDGDDLDIEDPSDEDGTLDNILAEDLATIDEDTLRDMISELIRQELQGVLGERITRNVRRLVRREIQRALAVRDLE